MPTVVQFRRGTTTQNANFTGANGELSIDTQVGTLRVHNGIDEGGSNIASVSYVDTAISSLSSNSITDGTTNFSIIANNGNIRGNVGGATITNIYSGGLEITGLISATGNISAGNVSATTFTGALSGAATSATTAGTVTTSAQGNITSVGTLTSLNSGAISSSGTVTGTSFVGSGVSLSSITGANVTGTVPSATSATSATTAGTVTTAAQGNITSVGTLTSLNSGAISSSGTVTGTSFIGIATSAQYADLAENYLADSSYNAGTVVEFGGNAEVTISSTSHSTAVAGIVSTSPAYLMNSHLEGEHVVAVALTGRVPCVVQGPVKKGTVLVSGTIPGTAMAIDNLIFQPGCVVGKAMESIDSVDVKTIEVAVGRL